MPYKDKRRNRKRKQLQESASQEFGLSSVFSSSIDSPPVLVFDSIIEENEEDSKDEIHQEQKISEKQTNNQQDIHKRKKSKKDQSRSSQKNSNNICDSHGGRMYSLGFLIACLFVVEFVILIRVRLDKAINQSTTSPTATPAPSFGPTIFRMP